MLETTNVYVLKGILVVYKMVFKFTCETLRLFKIWTQPKEKVYAAIKSLIQQTNYFIMVLYYFI